MSDVKVTLKTIVEDEGIKTLSKELADATSELKKNQKALKELEKAGQGASDEAKKLRSAIVAQKAAISAGNKSLREMTNNLANVDKNAGEAKKALKDMVSSKLGIDIDGITSKLTSANLALAGMVTAAGTIAGALVSASRDVSAFSNQFVAYTKNAKQATEMYNRFNEVYRNTNYDEQAVYDMAKGFMNVGISAKESADLITLCADASASMGEGVEFANSLADAFKRLATGGELTEKQYKQLAEAGIDLTDVEDQLRKGGVEAYDALKQKLAEYEGGMNKAKGTAAEMEGDIKGNCIEIMRQTGLLIDEIFGFSDALKEFYQWLIDVTQKAIDGIKNCIAEFRTANADAKGYSDAIKDMGEEYDRISQLAKEGDQEAAKQLATMQQQAYEAGKIARAKEEEAIQADRIAAAEAKRHQVRSIASGGSAGVSSGDPYAEYKNRAKAVQEAYKSEQEAIKATNAVALTYQKAQDEYNASLLTGAAKEQVIFEQKQEALIRAQNIDNQATADKIAMMQELMSVYQEAYEAGMPGSEAYLANLEQQIALEQQNLAIRQQATNLSLQTAQNQNKTADSVERMNYGMQQAVGIGKQFGSAITDWITGTKSLSDAMKGLAESLIRQAIELMAQWASVFAIVSVFSGPKSGAKVANKAVFGVEKFATGGLITGAGGPMSDDVPAMLSPGEFVLNASAVNAIGADNLARVNAAGVGADIEAGAGSTSSVTYQINALDSSSFANFLAKGGGNILAQYTRNISRDFSTDGVW